jgi:lysylphosphatidylglycerol synthetase-like protein (DUF2156 family)
MSWPLMDSDIVVSAIREYSHADNPSAYFAFNSGNSYFHLADEPGMIVYRQVGGYLVQFGGPFAPADSRVRLLQEFAAFAAEQGRQVVAVQVQAGDAKPYLQLGFTVNQMGASYAVDLDGFSLQGTRFMRLRNKISRTLRAGVTVHESRYADWQDQVAELDARWLASKGPEVKPLEFLVGQTGGPYQSLRRFFVAVQDGRLAGYISYSPVYGTRPGWMHDLSRRRPDGPPGVMEAINSAAIDTFRQERVRWLHFGFTPFTSLTGPRLPGYSRAFHWFMEYLWEHGEHIYPARTQLAYKEKWAPSVVLPDYIAFQHGASLPAIVHVFRACNAI